MKWFIYIGGFYPFFIASKIALYRMAKCEQPAEVRAAFFVSILLIWVWICWRFI